MWPLLYLVPKNYLSYLIGKLAAIQLPKPIASKLVKIFAKFAKINLDTLTKPIDEFKSIAEFFLRDTTIVLPNNCSSVISPTESTLRSHGAIENQLIPQVKGIDFNVSELLGDPALAVDFLGGEYVNLYLSPRDYHQVHVPLSGEIYACTYVPGKLWPVNDWSLASIPNLFCINERITTFFNSSQGKVALVMVGATNVGSMSLTYNEWKTNQIFSDFRKAKFTSDVYQPSKSVKQGDKLGAFNLGSSVILIFAQRGVLETDLQQGPIKLFQNLSKH